MLEHAREFSLAADHPCLAGHFPGQPVVPAVVLLEWVARALAAAAGPRIRLTAVAAAKFSAPVLPNQRVRVELQIEAGSARFRLSRDGTELAAGRVEFTDGGGR